jgi:hypothetical protein
LPAWAGDDTGTPSPNRNTKVQIQVVVGPEEAGQVAAYIAIDNLALVRNLRAGFGAADFSLVLSGGENYQPLSYRPCSTQQSRPRLKKL